MVFEYVNLSAWEVDRTIGAIFGISAHAIANQRQRMHLWVSSSGLHGPNAARIKIESKVIWDSEKVCPKRAKA